MRHIGVQVRVKRIKSLGGKKGKVCMFVVKLGSEEEKKLLGRAKIVRNRIWVNKKVWIWDNQVQDLRRGR